MVFVGNWPDCDFLREHPLGQRSWTVLRQDAAVTSQAREGPRCFRRLQMSPAPGIPAASGRPPPSPLCTLQLPMCALWVPCGQPLCPILFTYPNHSEQFVMGSRKPSKLPSRKHDGISLKRKPTFSFVKFPNTNANKFTFTWKCK